MWYTTKLLLNLILNICISVSLGDISHLLPQDYSALFHQYPTQQVHFLHHYADPVQSTVEELYKPPTSTSKPLTTTTEFTLPEVVENRQAKDMGNFIPFRQHYLPPTKPSFESTSKAPLKPPVREDIPYNYERPATTTKKPDTIVVFDPSNTWPGYNYQVPQVPVISTPAPVYLPPALVNSASSQTNSEFLVKITDMRCLQQQGGYFRAIFQINHDLRTHALIESETYDKRCKLKQSRDSVLVDISETNFKLCGVRNCGSDLCLRVRFPIINGVRTANDGIVTLHCKSQERVAAKVHAIQMGVTNEIQARSLGNYFHGGSQNILRTHVELLRRGVSGITQILNPNEAVQLGEELLLRAHVLPGDGWNYTKLTDVTLQRRATPGENINVIELISSEGCTNPALQSICAEPAQFDPSLGHTLAFKAVMFQGMNSGDEVVLSMKISGCLEARDCEVQSEQCHRDAFELSRRKRTTTTTVQNNSEAASEISLISFRVAFDNSTQIGVDEFVQQKVDKLKILQQHFALAASLAFVVALIILGMLAHLKLATLRKN